MGEEIRELNEKVEKLEYIVESQRIDIEKITKIVNGVDMIRVCNLLKERGV